MPCYSPLDAYQLVSGEIRFSARHGHDVARELKLRCGQCIGCRAERRDAWAVRICCEAQDNPPAYFVTLTYREDDCPRGLEYPDFQKFLKRARRKFGRFRFFVAGEYGEQTNRPHFHACLFGLTLRDLEPYRKSGSGKQLYKSASLDAVWSHGFCSVGFVTFESAAYTAAYICKAKNFTRVDIESGEVLRSEFARMSLRPGVGARFSEKFFRSDILVRDGVVLNGTVHKVPRYFSDLFKVADPLAFDALEYDRITKAAASALDRTPERLAVREELAHLKAKSRRQKSL